MFSIFSKKYRDLPDLSELRCDVHSHFIPGIDDGSPDMDTSIYLIRGLVDLGYKKIITTPHVISDMYPNTPQIIKEGYREVVEELRLQKIDVEFSVAAEYLMDSNFGKMLDENAPLLTLKDNLVLVELSLALPSIDMKELLFSLQIKGYQPVIAHPERYLYFGAHKEWYDEMKDTGCLFQMNLLSLISHYGKGALELAHYLIKKKYVDLLGTDMHHERHLRLLSTSTRLRREIGKLLDTGMIRNAGF